MGGCAFEETTRRPKFECLRILPLPPIDLFKNYMALHANSRRAIRHLEMQNFRGLELGQV